jgi:flagellar hook-associated protein 1 FlgK
MQALGSAMSGLRANQAGLALVAGNVANADTSGYVRKTQNQVATSGGEAGVGVRVIGVDRQLELYVQRQLQVETAGGSYAALRADFYQRLQKLYGEPGSDTALETIYNKFTAAVQGLATSPDSSAIRNSVISSAQLLTQQLNGMSADIQALRSDAEAGLSDSVRQANEAMQQIASINRQLGTLDANTSTAAVLLDQRDNYINRLSELMDVRVVQGDNNQVTVFTNSDVQLVGGEAAQLTFDGRGTLTPHSQWSADPAERSAGTLTLVSPNGGATDLLVTKGIRSGKIAAYLEMRDDVLNQAQAQLDAIAAGMASVLSDRTTAGTAVPGPPAGFDVDAASLQPGNRIEITYTDSATGASHTVTIVNVDDPGALPLADSATARAGDKVVGVDFSAGMPAVLSQLQDALGSTLLQFSNPGGSTLRIVDDGGTNRIDVTAASVTRTATSLTGGSSELPFFVDGTSPYTGAIRSNGPQSVGFAGRIAVNAGLLTDPSRLVVYQTSPLTPAGDITRPNFLYDQLTKAVQDFSPEAGIGSQSAPFSGSLASYLRQMISQQGQAAEGANSLKEGQDLVVKSLQQRFNDRAGVNVDSEMATLLQLQTSYGANARVMTTVRDLIDLLMQM